MTGTLKATALPWPVALPAAVLVHVAVLSLNLGVLGQSSTPIETSPTENLLISVADPESDPQPEIIRVGAADTFETNPREFAARLAGPQINAPLAEPARAASLEPTQVANESIPQPTLSDRTERAVADAISADFDAPLDAGSLAPQGGTGSGRAGSATGGADNGSTAGTGNGLSGTVASGQGGKDLFSRVANQMAAEHQRASFALKGQPNYPRACRQGVCRNGVPCEGSSEWRVTVGPSGGAPSKIEAVSTMDCELQNASVRKFFSDYKFPASERTRIYIFPVKMRITQ